MLAIAALLGLFALPVSQVFHASAQDGSGGQPGGRTKTETVEVTEYVWRLISKTTGKVLCEVLIEHTGYPNETEAYNLCVAQIYSATGPTVTPTVRSGTATPTPAPTQALVDFNNLLEFGYWKFIEERHFTRTITTKLPDLIVSITAPPGPVPQAYVQLNAYEPVTEYKITAIRGMVNNKQFECPGAPCRVTLTGDSSVTFFAVSSSGDESIRASAFARVVLTNQGYEVTLSQVTPVKTYTDSCSAIWGMPRVELPEWARFPATPEQLNTGKNLYYLAGKLLASGVVDASECPGRGFLPDGSANACGMEKAYQAMVGWQNQFDPIIWQAGGNYGIPPKLIKAILERESQFWPGNSRYYIYEYGLAQMNQIGADVALRWDNNLYQQVCEGLLFDCTVPYASLPSWQQAVVRGGMIRAINAECPTCRYGVDLSAAQLSIPVMSQLLRSNCSQVKYITNLIDVTSGYEDLWKFTLVSYHSGYQCLFDALNSTRKAGLTYTWENVSARISCGGASDYVNSVWTSLTSFDTFALKPQQIEQIPAVQPTFAPTVAPTLAPTPIPSRSTTRVIVFIDANGDGIPQPNEFVDGVTAQITLANGTTVTQRVTNGFTDFDMSGQPVGSFVTISLPTLYRQTTVRVIEQGVQPVIFRLEPPQIPTKLP